MQVRLERLQYKVDKISGASSNGMPFYSYVPKEEDLANKLSEKGIKVSSEAS